MEELRTILDSIPEGEGGLPLAVLYSRCYAIHSQQDRLVASRDLDLIDRAIALLSHTLSVVESRGVFSSNEDRDDLATADIKYLLVPFYLGSLLSAAPVRTDGDVSSNATRLAAANRAAATFGIFLQRCEQYDLLGALGHTAYEAAAAGVPIDPAAKRTYKVEKFKREKALNAALGALEARRLAAAAQEREDEACHGGLRASSVTTAGSVDAATVASLGASGGGGGGGGGGMGGVGGAFDEEDERRLWVWRVELAVLQALDLQGSIRQEADILQHAAAREATAAAAGPGPSSSSGNVRAGGDVDREEGPGEAEKADLMARLRAICQDLGGNRREQMRQDVFKPSHILPTMTVEEAGEIERREAMEREEQQRWQEEKERQRRAALDSDEEDAEDKAKQRAWDDWRDYHPKGYGNSKLRPCG
ncbi:hypothetical protein Vretimale_1823 [Volvox reticuliferus]|uniref:Uncharacterized protein n=1 Tax=Volvox reticuliferus TaxID=1737510 RepID=A0A8J4CTR0_9CHLO|nr:hypothetical protein Vretifemale_17440 [Volvox reticuliferus]GIL95883.1 hypothetical protein Vretimale_1823 [Volvox reticuliferus]